MKRKHLIYLGLMLITVILNLFLPLQLRQLSVCILIGVLAAIWSTQELIFDAGGWFDQPLELKTKWPFFVLLLLAISCGANSSEQQEELQQQLTLVTVTPEGCTVYRLHDSYYNDPVIVICPSVWHPAIAQH